MKKAIVIVLLAVCAGGAWWCQRGGGEAARATAKTAAPSPVAEMIVAGLGGFRGIASEVVWFRADRLQNEGRYGELAQLATWLTYLEPHTPEEQRAAMEAYCAPFAGRQILCYCHYCLEGLKLGGAQARHLAEVLFP